MLATIAPQHRRYRTHHPHTSLLIVITTDTPTYWIVLHVPNPHSRGCLLESTSPLPHTTRPAPRLPAPGGRIHAGWRLRATPRCYRQPAGMDVPGFYAGAGVFITGATGFVGKVVLEKVSSGRCHFVTVACRHAYTCIQTGTYQVL